MSVVTTNHQALERLASTARTLGHLMQDTLFIKATKEDFERWYKELSDFVNRVGNEDLKFILKKYDLDPEKPHPNILEEYGYGSLFAHYVKAIEEMRNKLQELKAITRAYNERINASGDKELIVGEYIIKGGNIFINDTDHVIKISGNSKILLHAFLTENDNQTLTGERVVQLTPSKKPDAVVEASKRIDKLNDALKPYHDKKRVVDSETKVPLVYKLHLAETVR